MNATAGRLLCRNRSRSRAVVPLTVLLIAVGAGACGGGGGDDGTAASDAGGTSDAAAEATCEDGTLDGRAFILCTSGNRPDQGLVIALHGRGSSAEEMRAMTRLDDAAATEELAVAFPAGMDGGWGDDSFTSPTRPRGEEDVAFIDSLIDELRADSRIDDRPVGLAGFSNGASMALRYAAERPDDVRAVVSVAGQLPRDPAIRPLKPVSLLQIYGSADPVRSYDAGIPADPDRRPGEPTPTLSTGETVSAFVAAMTAATHDGPSESDPDPADGTRLRTQRWVDPGDGTDDVVVVLHEVVDGGHTWPSAHARPHTTVDFGPTSRDIDASAEAIAFMVDPGSVG